MDFVFERHDFRSLGLDLYQIIYAYGSIESGDNHALQKLAEKYQLIPGGAVYLQSEGGDLRESMIIGRLIRSLGLDTHVRSKDGEAGKCYSAATLAFLGGHSRFIDDQSIYGVHRFYFDEHRVPVQSDLDEAQIISAHIIEYMQQMGINPELFRVMSEAGRYEINPVTQDNLIRLGVINDGIRHSAWRITAEAGGILYLKGEIDNGRGLHKLTFFRNNNRGVIVVGYIYSSNPDAVLEWQGKRGVFVDERMIYLDAQIIRNNNYIIFMSSLDAKIIEELVQAQSVGVFVQPLNDNLYAGFTIRHDSESKRQMANFFEWCTGVMP